MRDEDDRLPVFRHQSKHQVVHGELELRIEFKRPRDVLTVRFSNAFKEYYDTLWERLRVEYHEERV